MGRNALFGVYTSKKATYDHKLISLIQKND